MKAELRIGNHIGQGEVMEIKENVVRVKYTADKERTSLIRYEDIQPLPLSEEVLLKCGCNISTLVTGLRYKHLYRLVWDDEFKYWDILQGEYGCFITRIQYLHEWQNFIHITNGVELEVSL